MTRPEIEGLLRDILKLAHRVNDLQSRLASAERDIRELKEPPKMTFRDGENKS